MQNVASTLGSRPVDLGTYYGRNSPGSESRRGEVCTLPPPLRPARSPAPAWRSGRRRRRRSRPGRRAPRRRSWVAARGRRRRTSRRPRRSPPSSAVPVLPATFTPGICAALPVPKATTPSISRRTWAATRRRVRAHARGPGTLDQRGPHVDAGVARSSRPSPPCPAAWPGTRPCPIADEPTSLSPTIWAAGGMVLTAAPGMPVGLLKPKRSAAATSRWPPTLTPERREDRVARLGEARS